MNNVLVVSYTPRLNSNTSRLLLTALEHFSKNAQPITHVDLCQTPPPYLSPVILNALLKRNFQGVPLNDIENLAVSQADQFLDQFLAADRIVMAFPMYNFSLPATVKAWLDVIIQKDRTFTINQAGHYVGLCQNKAVLIATSSGSDFNQPQFSPLNYATPLLEQCFSFMGIPSHSIAAYGLNQSTANAEEILSTAQHQITQFLSTDTLWRTN